MWFVTKAALVAVLQLSFQKTILKLHLRVQTTSKQLRISIFASRIFRPTCMFTDKELKDSGREINCNWQGNSVEEWSKNTEKHKEVNYMSSWGTRVWDDWVKERKALPWQRHFLGSSKPWNFKVAVQFLACEQALLFGRVFSQAIQFRTVVLAVEIDEPPTKKIRECGAKETQLSLILVIVTSCLMFPINICKFFLHEKLIIIKMRGDYVLMCMQGG